MRTLVELFEKSVSKFADNPFLLEKRDGVFIPSTYKEIHKEVFRFAAGLMALGIEKGDRIAILSEGRNQWLIAELGIFYAGACSVPLSIKLDPKPDLSFRLEHSESSYIILSASQAPKLKEIRSSLPALKGIIFMDAESEKEQGDYYWNEILEKGEQFLQKEKASFDKRWQSVQPEDLANISYTSGTTADPKGIMLSQKNYAVNVVQSNTLMSIDENYRTFTILPWDHAFAHTTCLYCFMYNGASIASLEMGKTALETLKNIPKNINEVKPHLMMSVPALAKNFRKNIETQINNKGNFTKKLFAFALRVSYLHNGLGYNRGKGFRFFLKPLLWFFDALIYKKIRAGFGNELLFFIGGGALLDIELQKFFYAIGIPMCQGYGLSEAAPVISSNSLASIKFGSSGKLVKYLELKIVDESDKELAVGEKGEIIVKGENVMLGYWKNPQATAETIKDGWLYTGDMGYMDKDGFLYVLGRFKSLLVGNDGEKYSPEGIEEAIIDQSPFIDQYVLYNEQSPYTTGFIVPNVAALKTALTKSSLDISSEKAVEEALKILQEEINAYKKGGKYDAMFPDRWLPAALAILDEAFTEDNKMLNSTLKVVRNKVFEHYADRIDLLYTPEGKNITHNNNKEAIRKLLKQP